MEDTFEGTDPMSTFPGTNRQYHSNVTKKEQKQDDRTMTTRAQGKPKEREKQVRKTNKRYCEWIMGRGWKLSLHSINKGKMTYRPNIISLKDEERGKTYKTITPLIRFWGEQRYQNSSPLL